MCYLNLRYTFAVMAQSFKAPCISRCEVSILKCSHKSSSFADCSLNSCLDIVHVQATCNFPFTDILRRGIFIFFNSIFIFYMSNEILWPTSGLLPMKSSSSRHISAKIGCFLKNSVVSPWTLTASSSNSYSGLMYLWNLLPVGLWSINSIQPISQMRSFFPSPVVSVSSTTSRNPLHSYFAAGLSTALL